MHYLEEADLYHMAKKMMRKSRLHGCNMMLLRAQIVISAFAVSRGGDIRWSRFSFWTYITSTDAKSQLTSLVSLAENMQIKMDKGCIVQDSEQQPQCIPTSSRKRARHNDGIECDSTNNNNTSTTTTAANNILNINHDNSNNNSSNTDSSAAVASPSPRSLFVH